MMFWKEMTINLNDMSSRIIFGMKEFHKKSFDQTKSFECSLKNYHLSGHIAKNGKGKISYKLIDFPHMFRYCLVCNCRPY